MVNDDSNESNDREELSQVVLSLSKAAAAVATIKLKWWNQRNEERQYLMLLGAVPLSNGRSGAGGQ